MKPILHYFDGFYPASGGIEAYIRDIANVTDDPGLVVTDAVRGHPSKEELRPGFVVKRVGPDNSAIDSQRRTLNRKPLFPLRLALDVLRTRRKLALVKRLSYRILHVHGTNLPGTLFRVGFGNFPTFMLGAFGNTERAGLPTIATVHGLLSRSAGSEWEPLEREFYRRFGHLVCVDRSLISFIQERWHDIAGESCIHWIPNSVDTDLFRYCASPMDGPIRIGFVGRLESSRGVKYVTLLAQNLPPNTRLVVVGAGSFLQIERLKQALAGHDVEIHYNLTRADVAVVLRSIHVLFNPVLVDGISRVSLEALSVGRPVAMFKGMDRYPVLAGQTGFLLDPTNDAVLGWADSLDAHRYVLGKMGAAGRRIVEAEFSIRSFGEQVRGLYRHVE